MKTSFQSEGPERAMLTHARLQTVILLCILLVLVGSVVFLNVRLQPLEQSIGTIGNSLQELDPDQQ